MSGRPKNHPFFIDGQETDVKSYAKMHIKNSLDEIEDKIPASLPGVPSAIMTELFAEVRRLADRIRQAFKHIK